jgi:hypothetical protein
MRQRELSRLMAKRKVPLPDGRADQANFYQMVAYPGVLCVLCVLCVVGLFSAIGGPR